MSKNNPVGNLPIEHPMLSKILQSAMKVYLDMPKEEVRALDKEIKSVTETNCSSDIYDIAKMLEYRVERCCRNFMTD